MPRCCLSYKIDRRIGEGKSSLASLQMLMI